MKNIGALGAVLLALIGCSDSDPILIPPTAEPVVQSVQVAPATATVPKGTIGRYEVLAYYSDGRVTDVSAQASYEFSEPDIVAPLDNSTLPAIAAEGDLIALDEGVVEVEAVFGGVRSNRALLEITAPTLEAIQITGETQQLVSGGSLQLSATGLYLDDSLADLTLVSDWQSAAPAIASVNEVGLVSGVAPGETVISARFEGVTGEYRVTVTEAVITSLEITPRQVSLPRGGREQFRATAFYSDNTAQDVTAQSQWQSSNAGVLTFEEPATATGEASALALGEAQVTARFNGTASNAASVTVTETTLEAIVVDPVNGSIAAGQSLQYRAVGRYLDGSQRDISTEVVWRSDDTERVTIDSQGLATGASPGTFIISASLQEISGQASLEVTDAVPVSIQITPALATVPAGTRGQLRAEAYYSDQSVRDVTGQARWRSSDPSVVTIVSSGTGAGSGEGLSPGTADITASFADLESPPATITVTETELTRIEIAPGELAVPAGTVQTLTATGIYLDGTTRDISNQVIWQSSAPAVAGIDAAGVLTTLTPGQATVSATVDTISDRIEVTVTAAAVAGLQLLPAEATVPLGTRGRFTLLADYTDNHQEDVTAQAAFSSSADEIVTVISTGENAGEAVALGQGEAQVSASFAGLTSNTNRTIVTAATLEALELQPVAPVVPLGQSVAFTATARYLDGTVVDITEQGAWLSDNAAVASVSPGGVASTRTVGEAFIAVEFGGLSASTLLTVSPAEVTSLSISPTQARVPKGTTGSFTALAAYSDASQQDVTDQAVWRSSDNSIVEVATGPDGGTAFARAEGMATVQAGFAGLDSNTASIEVIDTVLVAIDVLPATVSLAAGTTAPLQAQGRYLDGTLEDLTQEVAWRSGDAEIVTVQPGGQLFGVAVGQTEVFASLGEIEGTATVSVTAPLLEAIHLTPGSASVPVGNSLELSALAYYSDGTSQDITAASTWRSSDEAVASVDNRPDFAGTLKANMPGRADITATYNGLASSVSQITVTGAALQAVQVTPTNAELPSGRTLQFTAEGLYSDGSIEALTDQVTWSSSNAATASVDATGLATAGDPGSARIIATFDGVSGSAQLLVDEAVLEGLEVVPGRIEVPSGFRGQFELTGRYSDGSVVDLTKQATWRSSEPDIVKISSGPSGGEAVALMQGEAEIRARFQDLESAASRVTVTGTVLSELVVSPPQATVAAGLSRQFSAAALFLDGSVKDLTQADEIVWRSSDDRIATVDSHGLATAIAEGEVTIEALLGAFSIPSVSEDFRGSSVLTVTGARVERIVIAPTDISLPKGTSAQLRATAYFSDNSTRDVTEEAVWQSSAPETVSVLSGPVQGGVVTGLEPGSADINAVWRDVASSPVTVTVTSAALTGLRIEPEQADLTLSSTLQYIAIGIYSDGDEADITSSVRWRSSNRDIVSIKRKRGLATANNAGVVEISASLKDPDLFAQAELRVITDVLEQTYSDLFLGPGLPAAGQAFVAPFDAKLVSIGLVLNEATTVDWALYQGATACDASSTPVLTMPGLQLDDIFVGQNRIQTVFNTFDLQEDLFLEQDSVYTFCLSKSDGSELRPVPVNTDPASFYRGVFVDEAAYWPLFDFLFRLELEPR